MKVKAISPYFGAKRSLAPEIVKLLGRPRSYWGLCFGSLAIEFSMSPCANETVVDLHGDITNLAWVLQYEKTALDLYGRMSRTLCSEENYLESMRQIANDWTETLPSVDRAFHYLFASWCGRSGMAGTVRTTSQIAVRWTANGGSPAVRFRSTVESIPDWHERMRSMLILRRDIFDVLPKIEDEAGTAVTVDPPYLIETRAGGDPSEIRGGGRYRHEFSDDCHLRLSKELSRFRKARVVLCYYDSPKLEKLYPGWEIMRHTRLKNLSVVGKRGAKKKLAPEVLLTNLRDGGLFSGR